MKVPPATGCRLDQACRGQFREHLTGIGRAGVQDGGGQPTPDFGTGALGQKPERPCRGGIELAGSDLYHRAGACFHPGHALARQPALLCGELCAQNRSRRLTASSQRRKEVQGQRKAAAFCVPAPPAWTCR